MKGVFALFVSVIFSSCFSQVIIGRVIDESDQAPLEYVNIRLAKKNIGVVSARDGEFRLDLSSAATNDTVRFSYIGYETRSVSVDFLKSLRHQSIKLRPRSYELSEMVVSVMAQTDVVGNEKVDRRYTGWGDFRSLRGRIRGLLIEQAECPVKVKSMSFRINHNEWDSVAFRVNFLSVDGDKPGSSILRENIFVTTNKKYKWVKVDLDKQNILICKNAIVTIEWIDAWGKLGEFSNLLTISLAKSGGYTFYQEPGEEQGVLVKEKNSPAIIVEVYRE